MKIRAIITIITVLIVGIAYKMGERAGTNAEKVKWEGEKALLIEASAAQEAIWEEKFAHQDKEHEEIKRQIQSNSDAVLDDYRNDNIKLRKSLQKKSCPARVSTVTDTTSEHNDSSTTGGLDRNDVEFLVRFAKQCQLEREQLRACQNILRVAK